MGLQLQGVLPVSAINLGLAAAVPALNAEVAKLNADISKLNLAIAAQATFAASPPDPAGAAAAVAAQLDPTKLAAAFAAMPGITASANATLVADLGLIEAQLAIVKDVAATIEPGFAAPAISGFSYAGTATGFGSLLEQDTSGGFGPFAAATQISGMVIATEDFSSWGSFASGIDVGDSADAEAAAGSATLTYLGAQGGQNWNPGVFSLFGRIEALLATLEGAKLGLEAQIGVSLGLNLPDVDALINFGLELDIDFGNIAVSIDLAAEVRAIELQIEIILDLVTSLNVQLSAGGLAFWSYEGPAGSLGVSLRDELVDGIPDGNGPGATSYGLVLAGQPDSITAFGAIFAT